MSARTNALHRGILADTDRRTLAGRGLTVDGSMDTDTGRVWVVRDCLGHRALTVDELETMIETEEGKG